MVGAGDIEDVIFGDHHFTVPAAGPLRRADDAQMLRLAAPGDIPAVQRCGDAVFQIGFVVVQAGDHIPQHTFAVKVHAEDAVAVFVEAVTVSCEIGAHVMELIGFGVQGDQILAVHGCHVESAVGAGAGDGQIIIEGSVLKGFVLELVAKILDFQCVGADPVDMTGAGSRVDMAVLAQRQAEGVGLGDLAQVLYAAIVQTEAVQMSPQEAQEEQRIVGRLVEGAVNGFVGNGNAQILRLAGFGIVDQNVAAGEAVPGMVIVGDGHPGGMAGTLVGGVGGHNETTIGHKADGRMELTGTDGSVLGHDHIFHPEEFFCLLGCIVIRTQAHITGGGDLRGQTVVEFAVGASIGVPNCIMGMTQGIAVLPDTGLVDQTVILLAM